MKTNPSDAGPDDREDDSDGCEVCGKDPNGGPGGCTCPACNQCGEVVGPFEEGYCEECFLDIFGSEDPAER